MEFNNAFIRSVINTFSAWSSLSASCLSTELSLENNNVFNRFLVTKVGGDEIEVPMIARFPIEKIISGTMFRHTGVSGIQTIVLPLYEDYVPQHKKTFDSFIHQFFVNTRYDAMLQKIISNKGEVYYGSRGLIFDDKYNPLIMCVLKARKQVQESGAFKMAYFRPVIYVNPIVFTEPNKLINKGIIKKIIPYYTTTRVLFPYPTYNGFCVDIDNNQGSRKATVIVDNLDRFFVKPTTPKLQSCINESLNECLINNVDDVLTML